MPTFSYRAVDREEVVQSGTIDAVSLQSAVAEVEGRELEVLGIEAVRVGIGVGFDDASHRGGRRPRSEPAGPMPPAAPRPLPPGVTGAAGGGFFLLFGSIFAGIASIFIIVGLIVVISGDSGGWFMVLFPMIHLTIGVAAIWYSLSRRHQRRDLAVNGVAVVAEVEHVGFQENVKINGRRPFKMEYRFDVAGRTHTGRRSTMNRSMTAHIPDDSIWVLYDADDPAKNMEWPPL